MSNVSAYYAGDSMTDRVFTIQEIGAKDSPERKRADEIFNYLIVPSVEEAGLEPYRADLDFSPGAITSRMLSELLSASLVIADLTGRNPNVFYELGITHSFAQPLISIVDSSTSLPFDAKNERVIELGEYPAGGLTYSQGEEAKASLKASISIVLGEDYVPASPLREVAANRSVDQLAPDNPLAAEMAKMRETLEEIRQRVTSQGFLSELGAPEVSVLRDVISQNVKSLRLRDINALGKGPMTRQQELWVRELRKDWLILRQGNPTLDVLGSSLVESHASERPRTSG